MNSRTKMTLIMTTMVFVSIISIVAIIAIFAANIQTFNSTISVIYKCEEVTGTASAKYYVGSEDKTGTAMREGGLATGATMITFNATDEDKNTSLSPVEKDIKLSTTKDYIVLEYYFTNGPASTDYSADLSFEGTIKNIDVTSKIYDEQITDHTLITDAVTPTAENTKFEASVTVNHKEDGDKIGKKYLYIKAAINDKTKDATFSGQFTFNLKLKQPYEGVSTNNNYLGSAQGYLNKDNIEINATPAINAKVVGVKNKSTGEWVDVNISSSTTQFIIDETSGEYEVVFNQTETSSSEGSVNYTLFTDAQAAVVSSISQISLASIVEPSESTKIVEVKDAITFYKVIGITADAITQGGYILSLPDSIGYVDANAFNLSNDALVGIQASEAVLNIINAPFKINFKNNLRLTHNAKNDKELGDGVDASISYNYNIVLSTSSNGNCFTFYYKGELTGVENTEVIANKQDSFVLLGKNAKANYNLKVANESSNSSLKRMVERESIMVGGSSLYETEGGTKNHLSDINPSVDRNFYNVVQNSKDIDISFIYIYDTESAQAAPCFIKGSKITLANGQAKPIEEIGYDDLLLVWDFEKGTFGASYPVWITEILETKEYYKITFDDGSIFYNVVAHRLYSTDSNYFEKSIGARDDSQVGNHFFGLDTDEQGNAQQDESTIFKYKSKEMTKVEFISESTTYYNLITGYTMNVFVNSILASTGMSNLYGHTPDMKYDEAKVAERQQDMYSLDELNVPAHYYYGLRLGEQKTVRSIPDINQYVAIDEDVARKIDQFEGCNYWIVTTSDDDVFSGSFDASTHKVKEGGTYTLAQPKNAESFVGWYCSADGKTYQAGASVTIRMGTHFTAIYE